MFLGVDPLDRLTNYSAGTTASNYIYDGDEVVARLDNSGNITGRFVRGDGPDELLASYPDSGATNRRWVGLDERNSVIVLSDGAGNATNINRYDEFGRPQTTNSTMNEYTGQVWLAEAGVQYSKARIYSPVLGRFLQIDPIGYSDGMNMYAYTGNDPVNNLDPTGMVLNITCSHSSGSSVSVPDSSSYLGYDIVNTGGRDVCTYVEGPNASQNLNNGPSCAANWRACRNLDSPIGSQQPQKPVCSALQAKLQRIGENLSDAGKAATIGGIGGAAGSVVAGAASIYLLQPEGLVPAAEGMTTSIGAIRLGSALSFAGAVVSALGHSSGPISAHMINKAVSEALGSKTPDAVKAAVDLALDKAEEAVGFNEAFKECRISSK